LIPNGWDRLDLFIPEGQMDFPVVMPIHGGALFIGEKESFEKLARYFASQGFASVSIN
jgi:acetyl esterase/lipase